MAKGLAAADLRTSTEEELDIKLALSNSFGFGGHNASLLFKQFRG